MSTDTKVQAVMNTQTANVGSSLAINLEHTEMLFIIVLEQFRTLDSADSQLTFQLRQPLEASGRAAP